MKWDNLLKRDRKYKLNKSFIGFHRMEIKVNPLNEINIILTLRSDWGQFPFWATHL